MEPTKLILVRHAESAPTPELPEADWPLSPLGRQQAQELVAELSSHQPDKIFSSPYVRAQDTVLPLATYLGLTMISLDDLRERKLSQDMIPDFLAAAERSWRDFYFARPGCESSRAAQKRAVRVLSGLVKGHCGRTLVVASHGSLLGLFLNHLHPGFGFEAWRAMPNPAVYELTAVIADDGISVDFRLLG